MKIALFKGRSLVSYAIRWITRSQYSHAAFVFDAEAAKDAIDLVRDGVQFDKLVWISEGSVVEAWEGGVRSAPSISYLHSKMTAVDLFTFVKPIDGEKQKRLLRILAKQIGDPYSYWNVLKFLSRRPGNIDGSWFCSELVFQDCRDIGSQLLERIEAWAVPPHWLQMSPLLKFEKTVFTG
jgi:hypothetical protein